MVNAALIARYGTSGKRAGFEALKNTLYWAFIHEFVKICEDHDDKSPSIKRVWCELKHPVTLKHFKDAYSRRAHLLFESEQESRADFRKIFIRLCDNADKLLNSASLKSYRTIRDKLIAHNELRAENKKYAPFDIRVLGLKYGEEKLLLLLAKEVMDDLNSLVKNSSFTWDSFFAPEERDALAFWEIETLNKQYPAVTHTSRRGRGN